MPEELAISVAITALIKEYISAPFRYLRESSPQARLYMLLEQELVAHHCSVDVLSNIIDFHNAGFDHAESHSTNRVQLEMKIDDCEHGGHGKTDVVLFKDHGPISLRCHRNGPADVVASIRAQDVLAAIELKACPSRRADQQAEIVSDVNKLCTLERGHPDIRGYFVLLDKSVSIPNLATTEIRMLSAWTESLGPDRIVEDRPQGHNYVEIWDIKPGENPSPRTRFVQWE